MQNKRRKKKKNHLAQGQLLLVVVLAAILVTVVGVAIRLSSSDQQVSGGPGNNGSTNISLQVQPLFDTEKVTIEEYAKFSGSSDPAEPLLMNNVAVTRNADGSFQMSVPLQLGVNQIVFSHKGETATYQVERRFVIQRYALSGNVTYNSGATVYFEVIARQGSQVKAAFNGTQVTLNVSKLQEGVDAAEGFVLYVGSYKLPSSNTVDLSLGKITYTATNSGITETCESGQITCLKAVPILGSDAGVTPSYGDYINVGSGYIAEIINYNAETFDGNTTDDYSHPTNSYLPKGTVDYCSTNILNANGSAYVLLRCGRRVYVDKSNEPFGTTHVTDCYNGALPDHNEIKVVSMERTDRHTVLTLDCLWKAPFYFELLPQRYAYPNAGADRDFSVSSVTATYVDITFCYATVFEGTVEIGADDPVFKSAELIRRDSDCTLRLYLKKTGAFYGWDSYYNEQGQLCFQFLNPAKVTTTTQNSYGVDLSGVFIVIDVGHGGSDGGATGTDANGTRWSESGRNMDLSYALRNELEKMGATVVFNREGVMTLPVDSRILSLLDAAPDLCVAVHQNFLAGYPNFGGFEASYYTPFSSLAAKQIQQYTQRTGIYSTNRLAWRNYFVGRQTVCPVVLTENGYMSHLPDLNGMLDPQVMERKAVAIAQGVADYFLLINGLKTN